MSGTVAGSQHHASYNIPEVFPDRIPGNLARELRITRFVSCASVVSSMQNLHRQVPWKVSGRHLFKAPQLSFRGMLLERFVLPGSSLALQ